jgi:hypothetical protein
MRTGGRDSAAAGAPASVFRFIARFGFGSALGVICV